MNYISKKHEQELLEAATELMAGDKSAGFKWLNTPQNVLDGDTPIEHSNSLNGANEVLQLIGRLLHGTHS